MRYKNTLKKNDSNGKRYYSPSFIKNIPIKDSDIFILTTEGMRFDMLAQRYYNDSNLWWIIAKTNEMGKGKLGVDHTKKLRIPIVIEDILDSLYTGG